MKHFAHTLAGLAGTLGLALGMALPAAATPYYHVTIDTHAAAGQTGYLDFLMSALADASPVHATIGNVSLPSAGPAYASGEVDTMPGPAVTIGNNLEDVYGTGTSEFGQLLRFGDSLGFDIAFALDPFTVDPYKQLTNDAHSTLSVALIDGQQQYLGLAQDAVDFDLVYGQAPAVTELDAAVRVAQVPEAPALWLSMTGLGLLGAVRRRAARKARRRG